MRKGSITVFAAMSMMLIASLLFALLESARYCGLDVQAEQKTLAATESVFAEYNRWMWENYHLLLLDGAYGGEEFSMEKVEGAAYQTIYDNLNYDLTNLLLKKMNLYQMDIQSVNVDEYQLVTDAGGEVFLDYVAGYMKENLTVEAARTIYEQIQQGESVEAEHGQTDSSIEEAVEGMKAEQNGEEGEFLPPDSPPNTKNDTNIRTKTHYEAKNKESNLLESVLQMKQNAVLGMVVEDVEQLSKKAVSEEGSLRQRVWQQGTVETEVDADWYAKILLEQYLTTYFSDYTERIEGHALDYELEYLICGRDSDRANLEGVVERLMLVREAGNAASILMDAAKVEEALGIATALAGATANPAIIKVVQIGIIGAWAYLESILDIRTLLAGGKIAMVKTKQEWTTDVGSILSSFQKTKKAKECDRGLTYQGYLMQFLYLVQTRELCCRAMNVMEHNLRLVAEYRNAGMDHMIIRARVTCEYSAEPLFWRLVLLDGKGSLSYSFCKTEIFSYKME